MRHRSFFAWLGAVIFCTLVLSGADASLSCTTTSGSGVCACQTGSFKAPITLPGLNALYLFDSDTRDSSGNGYDLTMTNGAADPYSFLGANGVDPSLKIKDESTLLTRTATVASQNLLNNIVNGKPVGTLAVWVKDIRFVDGNDHQHGILGLNWADGKWFRLDIQASGSLVFAFYGGAWGTTSMFPECQNSPDWTRGGWWHIVFTSDGTNVGIQYRSAADASYTSCTLLSEQSGNPVISTWTATGSVSASSIETFKINAFNALNPGTLLDEVRVYNRVLSSEEILQVFDEKNNVCKSCGAGLTTLAPGANSSDACVCSVGSFKTDAYDTYLIAHYGFDGDTRDLQNPGNVATLTGNGGIAYLDTTHKIFGSHSVKLTNDDGLKTYVLLPQFELDTSLTISLWFRWDVTSLHDSSYTKLFWLSGDLEMYAAGDSSVSGDGEALYFVMYDQNNNRIEYKNSDRFYFSNNVWYHVSWVVNKNSEMRVFVDGEYVPRTNTDRLESGKFPLWGASANMNNNRIGTHASHDDGRDSIDGHVEEFRLYNTALPDSAVKALYEARGAPCMSCSSGLTTLAPGANSSDACVCPSNTYVSESPRFFSVPSGDFDTVQASCKAAGGALASIHDAQEQQEAYNLCLETSPQYGCYIGLRADAAGEPWYWVDSSTVTYTNWQGTQGGANGISGSETAVILTSYDNYGGEWSDWGTGDSVFSGICRRPRCTSCPVGMTSPAGSTSADACVCPSGSFTNPLPPAVLHWNPSLADENMDGTSATGYTSPAANWNIATNGGFTIIMKMKITDSSDRYAGFFHLADSSTKEFYLRIGRNEWKNTFILENTPLCHSDWPHLTFTYGLVYTIVYTYDASSQKKGFYYSHLPTFSRTCPQYGADDSSCEESSCTGFSDYTDLSARIGSRHETPGQSYNEYENNAMAGSVFGVYGWDQVLTDAQIQTVIDSIVVDGEDDARVLHGGACTACQAGLTTLAPGANSSDACACQAGSYSPFSDAVVAFNPANELFGSARSESLGSLDFNIASLGFTVVTKFNMKSASVVNHNRIFDFGGKDGVSVDKTKPNYNIILFRGGDTQNLYFSIWKSSGVWTGVCEVIVPFQFDTWHQVSARYHPSDGVYLTIDDSPVVHDGSENCKNQPDRTLTTNLIADSWWSADSQSDIEIAGVYAFNRYLSDAEAQAVLDMIKVEGLDDPCANCATDSPYTDPSHGATSADECKAAPAGCGVVDVTIAPNPFPIRCSSHKFCVQYDEEANNIFCYGSSSGCLWNTNDCSTDTDCLKYDKSSPRYGDDPGYTCYRDVPNNYWQQGACDKYNPLPTLHLQTGNVTSAMVKYVVFNDNAITSPYTLTFSAVTMADVLVISGSHYHYVTSLPVSGAYEITVSATGESSFLGANSFGVTSGGGLDLVNDGVTSGLIAHWKFDGDFVDATGNYPLTTIGTEFVDGHFGQGIYVDSTNTFYTTSNFVVGPTSQNTFSFWVKKTRNNANDFLLYISADVPAHLKARKEIGVLFNSNNKINFYIHSGGDLITTTEYTDLTTWMHIVVVLDNEDQKIYVNAQLEASQALSNKLDAITDSPLRNSRPSNLNQLYYDDFRVYNRVLTDAEITALYQAGARIAITGELQSYSSPQVIVQYHALACPDNTPAEPACTAVADPSVAPTVPPDVRSGLLAQYKFDDLGGGEGALDSSGNGKTLTGYSITYENSSVKFNDNVDFFEVVNDGYFNPGKMTISFWAKLQTTGSSRHAIASCRTGSSPTTYGYVIYQKNDGSGPGGLQIYLGKTGGGWYYITAYTNTITGSWQHFLITIDRQSTDTLINVFIDKTRSGSQQNTGAAYNLNTATSLQIGDIQGATSSNGIYQIGSDSYLDEFRLYDRILTQSEIDTVYEHGSHRQQSASVPAVTDSSVQSKFLTFDQFGTTTLEFSEATTGEVLVVSSSTYTHVQNVDLSGEYTVTVAADASVVTDAAGAVVGTSAGGTTYPLPRWVLGAAGATCDDTCGNFDMNCDSLAQTAIRTQSDITPIIQDILGITCVYTGERNYAGTPFIHSTTNKCYAYTDTWTDTSRTQQTSSVCDANPYDLHRPLCRCVPETAGFDHAITGVLQPYATPQVVIKYDAIACPPASGPSCTDITAEITTALHFTFRTDESPYSWQEAHDEAIANGNRIPTKEEMQDYLAKNGRFNSVDQWAAVTASNTFGADWIQIGQHANLPLGASLVDIGHSVSGDSNPKTFWNDDTLNTFSYQSIYVEVKSLIPTPTAVAGHDKEQYLVFESNPAPITVSFPESPATTGEVLVVSGTEFRHISDIALSGEYTVTVAADASVVTDAVGAVVATSAGGTGDFEKIAYSGSPPASAWLAGRTDGSSDGALAGTPGTYCQNYDYFGTESNLGAGGACLKGGNSAFLQLDLGEHQYVYGIITQGRDHGSQYVTAFSVEVSTDETSWTTMTCKAVDNNGYCAGNTATGGQKKENEFTQAVKAQFVRLYVRGFNDYATVRMSVRTRDFKNIISGEYVGIESARDPTSAYHIDGGGWTLVRRTAGPNWHPTTDELLGEIAYGTHSTNEKSLETFSIPFSDKLTSTTEFLFATGDGTDSTNGCDELWLVATIENIGGKVYQSAGGTLITYANEARNFITKHGATSAKWYNRAAYDWEPIISVIDYDQAITSNKLVYLGNGGSDYNDNIATCNGMNVFIRNGAGPSINVDSAITGEAQAYAKPQVILRYKSEVCPTTDTTDPSPCPLDGTYVASCGCPADYYQTTNAGDTTCTPCPDSLVSPAQSTSADHCTQPGKKVTFSLALSGTVSAAEFTPGLRGRIKAKIARNLRVSPKRVTIVSVQDARRRLLAVSLEVEVTAEDEAEAQTLTSESTSITSAVEEAASEENVTLTAELTSSASEAVVATCCFKTWPN